MPAGYLVMKQTAEVIGLGFVSRAHLESLRGIVVTVRWD